MKTRKTIKSETAAAKRLNWTWTPFLFRVDASHPSNGPIYPSIVSLFTHSSWFI